jgi:hypothetical protein
MAFGKKAETGIIEIKAPNFQRMEIPLIGTAPYVTNNMSPQSMEAMKKGMEGKKLDKKAKSERPAKDFKADYEGSIHRDRDAGWIGIPAAAFRAALIRACGGVGIEMTRGKQAFFIEADGADRDGKPLVKITKGEPAYFEALVKNSNGGSDLRARARFDTGWEALLRISYDADVYTETAVANLTLRAGVTVGVGAGRPFSSASAGCGWGTFTIKGLTKEQPKGKEKAA